MIRKDGVDERSRNQNRKRRALEEKKLSQNNKVPKKPQINV